MNKKDIALNYLKQGLSVIPLFSPEMIQKNPPKRYTEALAKNLEENAKLTNSVPETDLIQEALIRQCKTPIITWATYKERHPNEEEVCRWFSDWPDANIGIVTGSISNLVVFDLDSEDALEYAEARGGFPDTPKAKTGKGYHFYMRYPDFEVSNRVNSGLKIDIRGNGGYAAAPPSMHGSGRTYEWEDGFSIFDIDPAPCEQWMIDYLQEVAEGNKSGAKVKPSEKRPESLHTERSDKPKGEYADILRNGTGEGNRNDTATRLAGHLLAKGVPESEAWEILCDWNNHKNHPPLDHDELLHTFESVCKRERKSSKIVEIEVDVSRFLDTQERILSEGEDGFIQIPFGGDNLTHLEMRMGGGLLGGRLYIFGGIPSASKTMLGNNITDNICLAGYPVLFFSYDDGRDELRKRTLSRFSGIHIEQFNRNRVDKDKITEIYREPQIREIMRRKYVVEEVITLNRWDAIIDQIVKSEKKAPVIIIDYLRKLRTERHIGDERLRVDEILCRLKAIAMKYNTPVLAVSELARDSYKSGQRLSMASFKESGSIEYDASWLGILAAVEEDATGDFNLVNNWERIIEDTGNVDLIVLKAKRGTGLRGRVPLKADRDHMIIRDREVKAPVSLKRQGKRSRFEGGSV